MSFPTRIWPILCACLAVVDCSLSKYPGNPSAGSASNRASVKIPKADITPPLANLDVIGRDTTLTLRSGDDPEAAELSADDSLVLVATGEDGDGGVKDFSLTGNAVVTCKDPGTGKTSSRSTGFMRRTVSGSVPERRAPIRRTSRFVVRPGDFAALCPGRGITGMVGQATVRAHNFRGGHAVSPRLEFRLPEAAAAVLAARVPPAVTQEIQTSAGTGYGTGSGTLGGSGGSAPSAATAAEYCPRSAAPQSSAAAADLPEGSITAAPPPGIPSSESSRLCSDEPVPFVSPGPKSSRTSEERSGTDKRGTPPQAIPKNQKFPSPREPRI